MFYAWCSYIFHLGNREKSNYSYNTDEPSMYQSGHIVRTFLHCELHIVWRDFIATHFSETLVQKAFKWYAIVNKSKYC